MLSETPIRLIKLLHKEDIQFFTEKNTLKISLSSDFEKDYREQEIFDPINDPWEGSHSYIQDDTICYPLLGGPDLAVAKKFFDMGIDPESQVHFSISGCSVTETLRPFHLISFSYGELKDLVPIFATKGCGMEKPYDAYIVFKRTEKFLDEIWHKSQVWIDGIWQNLGQYYQVIASQQVAYKRTETNWTNGLNELSGFVKNEKFAAQKEFRVCFGSSMRFRDRIDFNAFTNHPLALKIDRLSSFISKIGYID